MVHPDDVKLEWPRVLGVTRTLGDLSFDESASGISREATVVEHNLIAQPDRLQFLVVATDGLWDTFGGSMEDLCDAWRALTSIAPVNDPADKLADVLLHSLLDAVDERGGHDDDLGVAICPLEFGNSR